MKAIVLIKDGAADEAFEFRELPMPAVSKGEVLIKVSHFGLNYADIMARKGMYKERPPLPCILGYEVVGEVVEVGSEVRSFVKGDLVLAFTRFGGYAEFASADARGVVKLAPGTNPEEATALATQFSTAWYAACHMINLRKGDRVLVHAAAGGVGTALVQIALWKGCEVFGTVGSDEKLARIGSMGVQHAINYRTTDFAAAIREMTGNKGIDVVFDPIGGSNFKQSFALLGSGGRAVTFGVAGWSASKGGLVDKVKLALGFGFLHPIGLLMTSRSVMGLNMLNIGQDKPEYLRQTMHEVYDHYRQGVLRPVVDSVFDAKDISKAHERLESRNSMGKVLLRW